MFTCYLYIFLGDLSVQIYCLIFFTIFCCCCCFKCSFYILDNSPLSDMSFTKVSYPYVTPSSHFSDSYFRRAGIFNVVNFRFSVLSLMDHAFAVASKKLSACTRSSRLPPTLSPRSFMVL